MTDEVRKRVLVVDDDPMFLLSMEFDMKRLGYTVATAGNGSDAIKYLGQNTVDAVISDICMPGIDGVELLKHIKQTVPNLPMVMLVTGFSDMTTEAAKDLGAQALFSKTHNRKNLQQAIRELVSGAPPHPITALPDLKAQLFFSTNERPRDVAITALNEKGIAVGLQQNVPQVYEECIFKVFFKEKMASEGSGVVSWVSMANSEPDTSGCGIEFLRMKDADREFIKSLLLKV